MFNKLKNKFTLIQVITISAVLIISFSLIYIVTKDDVDKRIDSSFLALTNAVKDRSISPYSTDPRPRLETYIIYFDEFDDLTYQTNTDYTETEITEIKEQLGNQTIEYNDEILSVRTIEFHQEDVIIVLNITEQQGILDSLLNTLLITSIVVLVVMAIISRFFAKNAIKPIEKSYKKQQTFVSDASHELRTPLAIMNSNLDILLNVPDKTEEEKTAWLNLLKDEIKNMTELSNSLLFLSSSKNTTFSDIDISELLKNRLMMYDSIFYENKLDVSSSIEDNLHINGSNTQINQLLCNFIDNAIKYTTNKKIDIELYKKNNKVYFKIKNETTKETIDKKEFLFDRFYKINQSRNKKDKKSFGLGLSIAKEIISNHKGKIDVKTDENLITFKASFPSI